MNAIEISHLSKKYKLGDQRYYYTLRDSLSTFFHNPFATIQKGLLEKGEFWALRDISFTVGQGEIVGLLGKNGAGKSTLLKVLSRITPPTQGEVILRGRLGSLLEVGTGFHPELSGRENIYLNGAILGMSRQEVQQQFDTIVEFSEVGKFLDTPMKHYSSGMFMRLAFSVAAHLQSEILLVDEVLAVGDIEFQKKCLGKMGDIAKQGRTILFVSHNMGAVQQLCTRCAVLEKGRIVYVGPTNNAIAKYLEQTNISSSHGDLRNAVRSRDFLLTAKLEKVSLKNDNNGATNVVDSKKPFQIELTYSAKEPVKTGFYVSIKDESRRPVLLFSSGHLMGKEFTVKKGRHTVVCEIDASHLTNGRYSVDCGLMYPNRETIDLVEDALFFTVTNSDPYETKFDYNQQWGSYHVNHKWITDNK